MPRSWLHSLKHFYIVRKLFTCSASFILYRQAHYLCGKSAFFPESLQGCKLIIWLNVGSQKIGSFYQRLCYLSEICFHFDCNFLRVCFLIFKCVTLNNTTFHRDQPGGRLHIWAREAKDNV